MLACLIGDPIIYLNYSEAYVVPNKPCPLIGWKKLKIRVLSYQIVQIQQLIYRFIFNKWKWQKCCLLKSAKSQQTFVPVWLCFSATANNYICHQLHKSEHCAHFHSVWEEYKKSVVQTYRRTELGYADNNILNAHIYVYKKEDSVVKTATTYIFQLTLLKYSAVSGCP